MLYLILFVAAGAAVCLLNVWSWPKVAEDADAPGKDETVRSGSTPAAEPESLEGVLVAQLVAGEISTTQYRHAVEGLAARDEDRHPLAVPPETGPAQA
jgi:hypothetical protein